MCRHCARRCYRRSQPTPCNDCRVPVARDKNWRAVKHCPSCKLARQVASHEVVVAGQAARTAARAAALSKTCPWCHAPFTATTTAQVYCCEPHNNIAKSVRRKARLRGAAVGEPPTLWAIYDRDGGRCALCLDGVDRSLRWPDKRCASLDHIIPISRGGKDGSDNVQLAHLVCNIRKNDRLPGEAKRPRRVA